ncbi:MAG: hypothetical protein KME08_13415 [Aphanothece sp. CMT-3BRIN-NPC111]|jgi:hypothetical protein|nr:hypothetical protein [Aphanothece sp. CMT-3BRIN-NPC111]
MKSFFELKLIGISSEQEKLIDRIEYNLCDGWTRAKDMEADFQANDKIDYRIFVCPKPIAALFLTSDENKYLYVCNIVPKESNELGVDIYNTILEDFLTKLVEPAASGLDIRIVTTTADRSIDNSMSPELAEKFKHFSNLANKSSGGTHPSDERRLFDLIIQAHVEKSLLDESSLRELLVDEGWSEEQAYKLSIKYNFGMNLLKYYNS